MKNRMETRWLILLGMLVTFLVHASPPASKQYLDSKMQAIQTQIYQINTTLFGE